jgi:hypothetical protein
VIVRKQVLCRSCGNEMNPLEYCKSCSEAVQWKCSKCERENDKSIHARCHIIASYSNIALVFEAAMTAACISGLAEMTNLY